MAFAPSTIPYFTAALLGALQLRPALQNVLISDGPPAAGDMNASEIIALLDVDFVQSVRAINRTRQPRDEHYNVNVLISIWGSTRSQQTVLDLRAWAFFAEFEDMLRADPVLAATYPPSAPAGAVIAQATLGTGRCGKRANDTAREAAIEFQVKVHARL